MLIGPCDEHPGKSQFISEKVGIKGYILFSCFDSKT